MSIQVEVWGDYCLCTRPEMKTERVSYDILTPSAARGILEALYWHPGLRYKIDFITVCNPIQFTNLRRNEVKSKISARNVSAVMNGGAGPLYISTSDDIQQRASLLLKDVRYIIGAHFEMTEQAAPSDNPGKFQDIIKRRLERGECFQQPYFGCREFPAHFRRFTGQAESYYADEACRDLGYMLYDFDYSDPTDIRPTYFRALMKHGVVDLSAVEVVE